MRSSSDILIIGGGVIGLTLAYLLAKEQVAVTLIDKSDLGQEASWAGAGILPAGNPKRAKSPMGGLRSQAVSFFPEFSAELKALTGIDNGYWQCGGLELRCSADDLEKKRLEQLAQIERREGLHCEILDSAALHRLEPNLALTFPGAIYFPGVAQIRNPRHLQALIAAAEAKNVQLLPQTPCQAIERDGERIKAVRTSQGLLTAGKYVMAAGTWTTGLLAELGWQPAVKPIRGQIVLLNSEPFSDQGRLILEHILLMGHQYLVPRRDGRILIGSTEEDVGFDKSTTESAKESLRDLAARTVPCLANAPVEKHWAGLRPGSPDGKPYLGQVPGYENLYVAAGHFRSGLQLSIITGILMRDLLLGRSSFLASSGGEGMDLTPFRPDRPATHPQPWIAHAQ
jgi:glycine oxidase